MVIALLLAAVVVVLAALAGVGYVLVTGSRNLRSDLQAQVATQLQTELAAQLTAQAQAETAARAREAAGRDDAFRHQLSDLGQRVERVTDIVARLREDRAGQHGQLLERVAEAHRVTEALRTTTEGL